MKVCENELGFFLAFGGAGPRIIMTLDLLSDSSQTWVYVQLSRLNAGDCFRASTLKLVKDMIRNKIKMKRKPIVEMNSQTVIFLS